MITRRHRRTSARWRSVLPLALFTTACAGSNLEVPADHPGHPGARSGALPKTTSLGAVNAQSEPAATTSPHSGHGEHDAHDRRDATPTYVCPMHPEIVSKQPGQCPICGMALELRKAAP